MKRLFTAATIVTALIFSVGTKAAEPTQKQAAEVLIIIHNYDAICGSTEFTKKIAERDFGDIDGRLILQAAAEANERIKAVGTPTWCATAARLIAKIELQYLKAAQK
jgi:hypothetical protein